MSFRNRQDCDAVLAVSKRIMYIILRLFDAGTLVWTIDSQRHCFFGLDEYGLKLSLGHRFTSKIHLGEPKCILLVNL